MKKTSTRRRALSRRPTAIRRELTRRDRELFGSRHRVSRNDQYFHLWQRILVRLAEVVGRRRREVEIARLDELAQELERAQRLGRLPASLVRKLVPGKRHGPPRQE